jgi:hypothetical protein
MGGDWVEGWGGGFFGVAVSFSTLGAEDKDEADVWGMIGMRMGRRWS